MHFCTVSLSFSVSTLSVFFLSSRYLANERRGAYLETMPKQCHFGE